MDLFEMSPFSEENDAFKCLLDVANLSVMNGCQ